MISIASHGLASKPISLLPNEAHVWLTYYNQVQDDSLRGYYRSLLSNAELEQQSRFHFQKDRLRYLVTRALVRLTLSRYVAIEPQSWAFSTNAYGRPEVRNWPGRRQDLAFNISHTDDLISLAVTSDRAIGVDVENLCGRQAPLSIADRYFSPDEVMALYDSPHAIRHHRFFEYWTFKESYIKARGMGLSLPLNKFGFHYPDERTVRLWIDPELQDQSTRWHFWQFKPTTDYIVALCIERRNLAIQKVVLREVLPGVHAHDLQAAHTRSSS